MLRDQRRLLGTNSTFRLFALGQSISTFGDAFFNIAILWSFYEQTGSALLTAIISSAFQVTDAAIRPIAGAYADRWHPGVTMVLSNTLAALVTGLFALVLLDNPSPHLALTLVAIIALNTATTFYASVRYRVVPLMLQRDDLMIGNGLITSAQRVATVAGMAVAGWAVDKLGVAIAVMIDALTFVGTALAIALAKIPSERPGSPQLQDTRRGLVNEIGDGWRTIRSHPILRELLWIGAALNAMAVIGPLSAPLVDKQLQGDGLVFGMMGAIGVIGGILAGLSVSWADRAIGTGRLMIGSWIVSGICIIGIGFSTLVPLTLMLSFTVDFCMTIGMVANMSYVQAHVAHQLLGRIGGIMSSVQLSLLPVFSVAGGLAADAFSVVPVFAFAGLWLISIALLAARKPDVRDARIGSPA